MILDNFLFSRFLNLALVFAFDWLENTKAVNVFTCEAGTKSYQLKEEIHEMEEILIQMIISQSSYKISAINGVKAFKDYLEDGAQRDITAVKGIRG